MLRLIVEECIRAECFQERSLDAYDPVKSSWTIAMPTPNCGQTLSLSEAEWVSIISTETGILQRDGAIARCQGFQLPGKFKPPLPLFCIFRDYPLGCHVT